MHFRKCAVKEHLVESVLGERLEQSVIGSVKSGSFPAIQKVFAGVNNNEGLEAPGIFLADHARLVEPVRPGMAEAAVAGEKFLSLKFPASIGLVKYVPTSSSILRRFQLLEDSKMTAINTTRLTIKKATENRTVTGWRSWNHCIQRRMRDAFSADI
jgi:hypothetical protein